MVDRHLINICFHGIGTPARSLEPGEDVYWIEPGFFDEILELIGDRPDVRLSFDDGNASDVEIALPALQRRHVRAEFFVLAARIGRPGSLDGAALRELADAGMVIGSHGMHHVPWRGLPDADLDAELATARDIIADESGAPITSAACPLGRYDRRVLSRLRRLGYRRVYTSDRVRTRPDAWLQPRYSVRRGDDIAAVRGLLQQRPGPMQSVRDTARIAAKRWR